MNKPVPKLQGKQSRISKFVVKSSSHLKNSVSSSGEQRQAGRNVHSSGSSKPSWNAYAGQTSGELQKQHSSFWRHETNGSKILSISEKAFGLLLIDNYFKKWQILVEGCIY